MEHRSVEPHFTDLHAGRTLTPADLDEEYAHRSPETPASAQTTRWVRANFVSSLDGAISVEGRSGALGSMGDKTVFHRLRALADVVLVGAGTARAEDYGGAVISAQDRGARTARGQAPVPPIAVVTGSGRIDADSRLFSGEVPPLVITSKTAPTERITPLRKAGAEVVIAGDDAVDPHAMIAALTERGLPRVLCEGGPHLFGDLIDTDLIDELCVTTSPHLVAGRGGRMAASSADALRRMRRTALLTDQDGFLYTRWVRDRSQQ